MKELSSVLIHHIDHAWRAVKAQSGATLIKRGLDHDARGELEACFQAAEDRIVALERRLQALEANRGK